MLAVASGRFTTGDYPRAGARLAERAAGLISFARRVGALA